MNSGGVVPCPSPPVRVACVLMYPKACRTKPQSSRRVTWHPVDPGPVLRLDGLVPDGSRSRRFLR